MSMQDEVSFLLPVLLLLLLVVVAVNEKREYFSRYADVGERLEEILYGGCRLD